MTSVPSGNSAPMRAFNVKRWSQDLLAMTFSSKLLIVIGFASRSRLSFSAYASAGLVDMIEVLKS